MVQPITWTPDVIATLRELSVAGVTQERAAERLGFSLDALKKACRRSGIRWTPAADNRRAGVWTPERIKALRDLANAGLGSHEIARRMHMTRNSVMGALHRNGIALLTDPAVPRSTRIVTPGRSAPVIVPTVWNDERRAVLAEMAGQGKTRAEIALALDMTEEAIRRAAHRQGIHLQAKRQRVHAPRQPKVIVWTPERLTRLREIAAAGRSMRDAGEDLGLSHGSIAGAAKHYGIRFSAPKGGYRASPAAKPKHVVSQAARAERTFASTQRRQAMAAPVMAEQSLRPAWTRTARDCCFPMWRHGERPGVSPRFCDAPVVAGRQYCGEHLAVCFRQLGAPVEAAA